MELQLLVQRKHLTIFVQTGRAIPGYLYVYIYVYIETYIIATYICIYIYIHIDLRIPDEGIRTWLKGVELGRVFEDNT